MLLQQASATTGQTQPTDPTDAGPPPAGGMPPSGPGNQFASDTLSGLLSVQQQEPPSAADLAQQLMSQVDTNGDGELSADEIQQALGGDTSSDLTSAIAKLDTNGDGQISTDELTSALQSARTSSHHHHHHHGAPPSSSTDSTTSTTDPTATTTTTSTDPNSQTDTTVAES
jgi:hypothetical protein